MMFSVETNTDIDNDKIHKTCRSCKNMSTITNPLFSKGMKNTFKVIKVKMIFKTNVSQPN